jgi:PspA associated protein B
VGLGDVLFGRKRLKGANLDKLFALSTAAITLETETSLKPAGVAAVVFKPLSAGDFARAETELDELLGVVARDSGSQVRRRSDSFGFNWIVIKDKDLEDLVTTTNLVSSELTDRGFGGQLLAALFAFRDRDRHVFLIYGFKRGTFWPFVPTGEGQERDNAEELRLRNELEGELPIEQDLTRWLGLFDAPLETG